MSEHPHHPIPADDAGDNDLPERDDIADVLAALRSLAARTSHPIVRACLEQAHEDIAHLTSCGDGPPAEDNGVAA